MILGKQYALFLCFLFGIGCCLNAAPTNSIASIAQNGLLFEVRRPTFFGMRNESDGSNGLGDLILKWDLVLKNVGEKKISVVTPQERLLPRAREPYAKINASVAGCVVTLSRLTNGEGKSEILKPKPSELDIVELEPGQSTLLGRLKFVYDPPSDGRTIRFVYSVEEMTKDFYPVWCGDLHLDLSEDQIEAALREQGIEIKRPSR